MRSWSIVYDELQDMLELARLVGETTKDISDEHTHNSLSFPVGTLDQTLFHWSPRCSKPVADA